MRMNRKAALSAGAGIAMGLFAAACSDSATEPTRSSAFVPKASFAVGDPTTVAPPNATELRICKAGDVGGDFTISWTPAPNGSGNPTVIDQNGGVAGNQLSLRRRLP